MPVLDHLYYYIFAFAEKTPQRKDADAWAVVFPSLFFITHAFAIYFCYSWVTGAEMLPSKEAKPFIVLGMWALIAMAFFFFVLRKNGDRIVREFTKKKRWRPALVGCIIFIETLTLPLWIVGFRILLSRG